MCRINTFGDQRSQSQQPRCHYTLLNVDDERPVARLSRGVGDASSATFGLGLASAPSTRPFSRCHIGLLEESCKTASFLHNRLLTTETKSDFVISSYREDILPHVLHNYEHSFAWRKFSSSGKVAARCPLRALDNQREESAMEARPPAECEK